MAKKQYERVSIEVGLNVGNLSGYRVVGDYREHADRYLLLERPEQAVGTRKNRKAAAKPAEVKSQA